jgi:anti-sigma B factor antagonist
MKVTIRTLGDVSVIDLVGSIKTSIDMEDFSKAITDELDRKHIKLLLNFSEVGFVNSSGLGRLVLATKKVAEKNGVLKVMNLAKELDDLFTFTRLKEKIGVYKDEKEALESFR